jgi:hypothetical protein
MREDGDLCGSVVHFLEVQWKNRFLDVVCAVHFSLGAFLDLTCSPCILISRPDPIVFFLDFSLDLVTVFSSLT